jgi:hypothetical protein
LDVTNRRAIVWAYSAADLEMQLTYAWCALYVALVVLGLLVLTFGQGEFAAGLV